MADQLSKGEEFEKKAEKKLSGWGLFGSKYEDTEMHGHVEISQYWLHLLLMWLLEYLEIKIGL